MKQVRELFVAETLNPCQIAIYRNDGVGYRIPEYQRPYDWSEENIKRLMMDIFSGFERLSHSINADACTFLGAFILVDDETKEKNFKAMSLFVIDGQQRLITLILLVCALIERLRILRSDAPSISKDIDKWISKEHKHLEKKLGLCLFGKQICDDGNYYPFPRIVRFEDQRADNQRDEKIKSAIAKFLVTYKHFLDTKETEFSMPNFGDSREGKKIKKNFDIIKKYCCHINDAKWYDDNDCKLVERRSFSREGYTKLWGKIQNHFDDGGSSAINTIASHKQVEVHPYFRTLMLAAYFCDRIAITTVVTDNEDTAFNIFDALNTTGELLTALETLKPKVMSHYKTNNLSYAESYSKIAFDKIGKIIEGDYPATSDKQQETKELVITFCLYLDGQKVSGQLGTQRQVLLNLFDQSCKTVNGSEQFMTALADVTRYRSIYWVSKNSGQINELHGRVGDDDDKVDRIKLLSAFIKAMNTSLALPVLSRYWAIGEKNKNFEEYIEVLEVVSAFLALRRFVTGTTDRIDTCFRDIMGHGDSPKKLALSVGTNFNGNVISPSELKDALRSELRSLVIDATSKEAWLDHVINIPIWSHSKPLARFFLFCATHNTEIDPITPGLLIPATKSDQRNYLSFGQWNSKSYATIEHVAPRNPSENGEWDNNIYKNPRLDDTLGNLVLLPTKENQIIGNAAWKRKKIFYTALVGKTDDSREETLERAAQDNIVFSKKTKEAIAAEGRLSMLDGIEDVEEWNAEFIRQRSRRLAELAWDRLWPWLEPKD